MKPVLKNTLIGCSAAYAVLSLLILLTTKDAATGIGLTGLILGILFFFFGLILCIPAGSRDIGKGLLLSAGLVFLIGVSVCSIFPGNMNFH
ncbi:MAG: hypothetical protein JWR61_34 [Ferruginibacter sp.]|jgi:hypothetical protein|uniref:hypothetical protein n=1 Tax=Ferruginibacter sp. TaxID=1940288 RepID=UPI002657B818|nr:hypothetical protein [Ferruginibacter sp.]MDB5275079.1 hypothetical protein [Ferruginibacter sp.]